MPAEEHGNSMRRAVVGRDLDTVEDDRSLNEAEPLILRQRSRDEAPDESAEVQAGVRRILAVNSSWTKWSLAVAYIGLYMMTFATSLEGQTTVNLTPFATSSFGKHSLVSTIGVVQGVVNSVIKPPMSKVADVFGRFEAFCFSVGVLVLGYILQASAQNIQTFAGAQVLYAAGSQGLQVLQQIFIADTSSLLNRALFATIPDLPFLITVWIGPAIANSLVDHWRWGYGIWTIVLPIAFLPLASSLLINSRKAARMRTLGPSPLAGKDARAVLKKLWFELDCFGLILLSAGISLILIPLTFAAMAKGGWGNGSIISMLVIGSLCLLAFPLWEQSPKFAPHAFFPKRLFRNKTAITGVVIAFFYFMAFYLSVFPFYTSYLLVVQGKSLEAAGHIVQTFTFSSTVTSILVSFVIKYTGRYKYLVTVGSIIYLFGLVLMISHGGERTSSAVLIACQVPIGVGGSMIHLPAQVGIQASANHQEMAAATALFLTLLEVGGAVGAAISGAIWSSNLLSKLREYLPEGEKGRAERIYSDVKIASMGWAFGTPERTAINRAYQETFRIILIVGVCVALPLIPLSLLMEDYRLDKMHQSERGLVEAEDEASELNETAEEPWSDRSQEWDESGLQRRRSRD